MLVSLKHGFVFLSTPKCASTSIERALQKHSDIIVRGPFKHANFRCYEKLYKPILLHHSRRVHIQTICLVREPISWLSSWFRYRSRDELKSSSHPSNKNSTANYSFDEFVEAYCATERPAFAKIGSQFDFVKNKKGEIGVEVIFAFENIPDLLKFFEGKVNSKILLPELNKSSQFSTNLDENLRKKVKEHLKNDFLLYERACRSTNTLKSFATDRGDRQSLITSPGLLMRKSIIKKGLWHE